MAAKAPPIPAPHSVQLALRLGWLLVLVVLAIKLWPYWSSAAAMFPADTNWIARFVALVFASFFLMFTPVLIGQLLTIVSLVLLARRQGWARLVFAAGAVAAIMVAIVAIVGNASLPSAALLYLQVVLVLLQIAVVALLFARDSNEWFRRRPAPQARPASRIGDDP